MSGTPRTMVAREPSRCRSTVAVLAGLLLCAGAACAAPATEAGDGAARLERMLAETRTVRARFTQVLLDADLEVVKEVEGEFALERPDRFRWDYAAPQAQTIVSDGTRLWVYDPELAQVTVKPLDGTLASSPAALLGAGRLGDNFRVTDLGIDGALHWIELVPRVDDTEFVKVRLALGARFVEVMELRDGFGQTTRITLRDAVLNGTLDRRRFEFVPPAGADVAGEVR